MHDLRLRIHTMNVYVCIWTFLTNLPQSYLCQQKFLRITTIWIFCERDRDTRTPWSCLCKDELLLNHSFRLSIAWLMLAAMIGTTVFGAFDVIFIHTGYSKLRLKVPMNRETAPFILVYEKNLVGCRSVYEKSLDVCMKRIWMDAGL